LYLLGVADHSDLASELLMELPDRLHVFIADGGPRSARPEVRRCSALHDLAHARRHGAWSCTPRAVRSLRTL
jgi:hypothetical protein